MPALAVFALARPTAAAVVTGTLLTVFTMAVGLVFEPGPLKEVVALAVLTWGMCFVVMRYAIHAKQREEARASAPDRDD